MNYYEHHLGDYTRDTAHLSMLEHGAYRLLLDRYYICEAGIPADQAHRLARAKSEDERAAVDAVLLEFFTLQDGVYRNRRADAEIEAARVRIEAARANGGKGGRPSKKPSPNPVGNPEETQQKPTGLSLGIPAGTQPLTQSEPSEKLSNLQSPSTRHQSVKPLGFTHEDARDPRGTKNVPRETLDGADPPAVLSPSFSEWLIANYPECTGRRVFSVALHCADVIVGSGFATEADLRRRVEGFIAHVAGGGVSGPSKVMTPQTFFTLSGEDPPWAREWSAPRSRAEQRQDETVEAAQKFLAASA